MLRTNYIGEHFGSESSVVFFPLVKFYRYCTASLLGSQHLFFTFEKFIFGAAEGAMYEIYLRLLEERGVSTADVCKATGISQSAMSNWKKRRGKIGISTARKIANFFGVTVEYLYGDDAVQNNGQQDGYYVYGETAEVAQEIFENKDMRILFSAARNSRPEDLRYAAELLQRFKQTNPDG